mmetsp:Transcript_4688/g.4597  ORF Transcript_4688/g.4597 Transcript_4688/m.4597 type:complete len:402 (-) Transcript_4688:44-1249(-)
MLLAQTLTLPANQAQTSAFVLSELQKNKLGSIVLKSKDILNEINPPILKIIESSLNNELFWIKWKLNQCQAFEKESCIEVPSKHEIELEEGEVGNDEVKTNKSEPLFDEYLREPTMENYLEKVYADLDPDEGIEEEYKCKKDPVYSWRLLRLVSQNRIDIFSRLENIDVEKVAIEIKKEAGEWVEPEENGENEGSSVIIEDENMEEANNGFSEENIKEENEEVKMGIESEGFEEGEDIKDEEKAEEERIEEEKDMKEESEKTESKREVIEIYDSSDKIEEEEKMQDEAEKKTDKRDVIEIHSSPRNSPKTDEEIKNTEEKEKITTKDKFYESLSKSPKEKIKESEKITSKKDVKEIQDFSRNSPRKEENKKIKEVEKIPIKREGKEINDSPRKSPKVDKSA